MDKMNKLILALGLVSISVAAFAQEAPEKDESMALAPAVVNRSEPNAFLTKPAKNHEALMSQVKNDSAVTDRFMRHFGKTREEVIDMMSGLRLDRLKEDGVYLVYNVPESGELRARSIYYKKGTPVWVDQMGNLVLKESCGNPMMRGTDRVNQPADADLVASTELKPITSMGVTGSTDAVPMASIEAVQVESGALATPASTEPLSVLTRGGSNNSALWLLPLAGAATLIRTGGGGDGGDGGEPICDPKTNPECIPEPATMVLMAAGIGGVVARKFRKK
jgi:PEP-CTERM motif